MIFPAVLQATVVLSALSTQVFALPANQPLNSEYLRSLSAPKRDALARNLAAEVLARRGALGDYESSDIDKTALRSEMIQIIGEKRLFGFGDDDDDDDGKGTSYAPYNVACGSNVTFIREATGISDVESEHIQTRLQPDRFLNYLASINITASDLNLNLTTSSNTSASPNVALAYSGGGYRAMINGAGGLWGTDSRHTEAVDAGTGQIGQVASYMAGLSGGSWMLTSYYANSNNTPPYLAQYVWNISSNLVLPTDGFFDTIEFYTDITEQAYDKKDAGYDIQITDVWALALSDHLFPDQYRASNTPNLTIADLKNLPAENVPYPLIIAVERLPNTASISENATLWEFSYNEFGTWGFGGGVDVKEARHAGAFTLIEYLGTSLNNGVPNSTNTDQCVKGFDNLGWVTGVSSTLFNQAFLQLNSSSSDSLLTNAAKAILAEIGSYGNDVATVPNPFIGWSADTNPTANWSTISLVDGGESNQNIPLEPLTVPARKIDAIFAFDNSADTTYYWPNGTAIRTTAMRLISLTTELDVEPLFPYVPSMNTFVNLGLNQHPTFFGCDANPTPNTTSPLVIYVPNYPWSSSYSNSSTFTLEFEVDAALEMIANGARTLTLNNTIEDWSTCLACAMADRAVARGGNNRSTKCIDCFSTWCWNGTVDESTPASYEPVVGVPPSFLNVSAKDAAPASSSNTTTSSSTGSSHASTFGVDTNLALTAGALFAILDLWSPVMGSVDFTSEIAARDKTMATAIPTDSPLSVADVNLPPASPSGNVALDSRDVLELSAFVEKKNWIEEKIEFLRGLRHIDCFIAMIPSFPDTQPISTQDLVEHNELPSYEDLENMYDEQDRIEEEAVIFDAGELVQLRQMARAASKKSLSREDTDLLSITLSTLCLLDTLMHLLRVRADTIDLLSYRLEWDTMRFALAKEFIALEREMKKFVSEKVRWSIKAYDAPSIGNETTGESSRSRQLTDESVRAPAAIGRGASRSQRILFAQTLELDFQSFRNRIANLRHVSIPQLDKSLTGMIDQAARLQSYNVCLKSTSLNSSQRSTDGPIREGYALDKTSEKEVQSQGAVPNFFLDEQDILEDRVDVLTEWESFLRACIQQWKHVDKSYHSLRKILMETINLSSEVLQSVSSHPSIETSKQYSDRASVISSELFEFVSLRDDPSFLCLSHPAFPDQEENHSHVVSLLDAELDKNKEELSRARKLVDEFSKAAEQVDRLNTAKDRIEEFTLTLKQDTQYLLEGSDQDKGSSVDFSNLSCLQPGSYAVYIAQLPRIWASIDHIRLQSTPYLKEITILLLVLKQHIGIDATFRLSVEATLDSFQESSSTASRIRETISNATELLAHCRELNGHLSSTACTFEDLQKQLSDALKRIQWSGLDNIGDSLGDESPIASFESRILDLHSTLSGSLAASLAGLASSFSPAGHPLEKVIHHISSVFESLCAKLRSLRNLFRLLSIIADQTKEMNAVNEEAQMLFKEASSLSERMSSASDLVLDSSSLDDPLTLLSRDVTSFVGRTKSLVSSIPQRIPLISSPRFTLTPSNRAGSITCETITSSPPLQFSDLQPVDITISFTGSSTAQDTTERPLDTSDIDRLVRADANTLAARLTSVTYDVEKHLVRLVEAVAPPLPQSKGLINSEEPQHSSSQAMSSSKRFPSTTLATMEDEILDIERHLKKLSRRSSSTFSISLKPTSESLISQSRTSTNIETMSEFKKAVTCCDDSLSALLDSIDLIQHRSPFEHSVSRASSPSNVSLDSLEVTFSNANVAFQSVLSASKTLGEDRRVTFEVKRLTTAMEEMRDIIDAKIETSTMTSGRTSRMSIREDPDSENDIRTYASLSRSCSVASVHSVASSRSSRSNSRNSSRFSLTHAKLSVPRSQLPSDSSSSEFPDLFTSKARISRSSSASSFISLDSHALSPTLSSASKSRANGQSPLPVSNSRRQLRSTPVVKHTPASSRRSLGPSIISPPLSPVHQLSPPPNRINSSLPVASRYKSPTSQLNKPLSPADAGPVASSQYRLRRSTASITPADRQMPFESYSGHQNKPTNDKAEGRVPTARRKPSVPKKDDTLDRAINKIVNDMKVEIPIEPHVRSDGVTEAGKYWIGIPPKLCFCRILRSKTVMVRVGGGWVELSKFLQDHFGYELPSGDLQPLSPALLEDAWPKGNQTPLSPPLVSTPRRPDRQSLPLPSSRQFMTLSPSLPPHTPQRNLRDRRESSLSPHPPTFVTPRTIVASVSSSSLNGEDQSSPAHPSSPGSPLVSLSVITRYNPGELSPSTPRNNPGRRPSPSPRSSLEPILGLGIRVPKPRLSSTSSMSSLNEGK
ncbi:phospholipase b [Phaffia rhodozyma]|uniref:Lysophospholipase n=1 Tax=Phaffia rhodozyma TaxID=264483 RepID=A0A0F7SK77_PHARH|nr:phospholipase b [Phaffia rhodozyma]